jgi:hypothetical protein
LEETKLEKEDKGKVYHGIDFSSFHLKYISYFPNNLQWGSRGSAGRDDAVRPATSAFQVQQQSTKSSISQLTLHDPSTRTKNQL